jgi:ribosomal protein L40E
VRLAASRYRNEYDGTQSERVNQLLCGRCVARLEWAARCRPRGSTSGQLFFSSSAMMPLGPRT